MKRLTREEFDRGFRNRLMKKEAGPVSDFIGNYGPKAVDAIGAAAKKGLGALATGPGLALATVGLGMGDQLHKSYIRDPRAAKALSIAQDASLQQIAHMFPEITKSDPEIVESIWEAILQFAPHVATNPRVAGTFMKSILQFPGQPITPSQIRELQQLELGMVGEMERRKPAPSAMQAFMGNASPMNMLQGAMENEVKRKDNAAQRAEGEQHIDMGALRGLMNMYEQHMHTQNHSDDPFHPDHKPYSGESDIGNALQWAEERGINYRTRGK